MRKNLRPRACYSTLAAFVAMNPACYGGSQAVAPAGDHAPPPRDNVKVVPPAELAQIFAVSPEGGIEVAATPWWADIRVDDILVMETSEHTPEGLLRRVRASSTGDGTITFATDQSVLAEVFEEGHLHLDVPLTASPVQEILFAEPGVTLVAPDPVGLQDGRPELRAWEVKAIDFKINDVVLLDVDENNNTTQDRIILNGDFKAGVAMGLDVDLGFLSIEKFEAFVTANAHSNVAVVAAPELAWSGEKSLLKAKLTAITVYVVVPIVIVPTVELVATYSADIDGFGISSSLYNEVTATAVAQYVDGDFDAAFPPPEFEEDFEPPSIGKFGGANIKVQIGPRLTTKVYALAGPHIDVLGHLRLAVADSAWTLFAGLQTAIGIEFKAGSWDWVDLSWSSDWKPYEYEVAHGKLGDEPCGNGEIDDDEDCDGAALGGASCKDLGMGGGTLVCGATCKYDTSGCSVGTCGDGTLDPGEACDTSLMGQSCQSKGHDGGTLLCTGTCEFDESGCCESICTPGETKCAADVMSTCDVIEDGCYTWDAGVACATECDGDICSDQICGNGEIDPGEDCDASDFDGKNCQNYSFDGGSLGCTPGCAIDTSSCCDDGFEILNAEDPTYTSDGSGCSVGGGVNLKITAEMFEDDKIRFRVKKTDNSSWGAPAVLQLYVGTGPTCGDPINASKETVNVILNQTTQIIDLPIAPYDGAWADAEVKEFWVGKSEDQYEAGRASGTISVKRNNCM